MMADGRDEKMPRKIRELKALGKDLIESFFMWYEQDGKTLPEPRVFEYPAA